MTSATFKPIRNTELPKSFRAIHLELAREPGHPDGDAKIGYTILAPLDADARIDASTWTAYRDACRVVRLRPDGEERGHLIHRPGGSWSFRYDVAGDSPEEVGFHFSGEKFIIGEYVSIKEHDKLHVYRVVSVKPV